MGIILLHCGSICQPARVLREIQKFETSTNPVRVMTNTGEGFIKSVNNSHGASALVSELVAAELGTWIGLKVPPFAIIENCEIAITMSDGQIMQPPFFFSKLIDGESRDFGGDFVNKLREPYDATKLVVFDTWIRNLDRYVESRAHSNDENILYSRSETPRKYELVPIDHTHCISGHDFMNEGPINWDNIINDEKIYGRFPEFLPLITRETIDTAIGKLGELERNFVLEVINSIPIEWGFSRTAGEALADFICQRADFLVQNLPFNLLTQADLPFMGN